MPDSMDDITDSNDDGFRISHIEEAEDDLDFSEDTAESEPVVGDKIKISFANLVQLIASHDFDKILDKRGNEEVVMSADLLADLASAHQETKNTLPVIFIAGLVIGIIITYFLLRF